MHFLNFPDSATFFDHLFQLVQFDNLKIMYYWSLIIDLLYYWTYISSFLLLIASFCIYCFMNGCEWIKGKKWNLQNVSSYSQRNENDIYFCKENFFNWFKRLFQYFCCYCILCACYLQHYCCTFGLINHFRKSTSRLFLEILTSYLVVIILALIMGELL